MSETTPLRILSIYRRCYPEVTGGGHIYLYQVARRLSRRGHDVHILASSSNPQVAPYEFKDDLHWHRFYAPPSNPLMEHLRYIKETYSIASRLHQEKPFDIINLHGPRMTLRLCSSSLFDDAAFVFTFHADRAYEQIWDAKKNLTLNPSPLQYFRYCTVDGALYRFYHHITRRALERSDAIVVLSDYVKSIIDRHYGSEHLSKITKIYSGVDTERFKPVEDKKDARRRLGLPTEKTIFLTIRRLVPRMGLFNLLEAIRILSDKYPKASDALFIIGGSGPLKTKLERRTRKRGLQGTVKITGYIPEEELSLYYQAADCFVLPTEELEGFGIVSIEALSSGIPVIATPSAASGETVGRFFPDFICKSHHPDDIAATLMDYLSRNPTTVPDATECREIVLQHYSWDFIIPQIESLFVQTVKKRRAS